MLYSYRCRMISTCGLLVHYSLCLVHSVQFPCCPPPHPLPPSFADFPALSLSRTLLPLPVAVLTVWLPVKVGAFCGFLTNLPGKTETICSSLGLRADEYVNMQVKPSHPVFSSDKTLTNTHTQTHPYTDTIIGQPKSQDFCLVPGLQKI